MKRILPYWLVRPSVDDLAETVDLLDYEYGHFKRSSEESS